MKLAPFGDTHPLNKPLRLLLALALALSSLALPAAFVPRVFAGDNDSPLQMRIAGTCQDATGLGVLNFGLGIDGTAIGDPNPNDPLNPTNGTFIVSGVPAGATIVEAWLYWNGSDLGNAPEDNPLAFNPAVNDGDPTVTLNNVQVPTPVRVGGPAFWATSDFSYAYRSNVLSIVTANGNYVLKGIDNLDNYINGAELVVVYRDPARDPYYFALADGMDIVQGSSGPASGPGTNAVIYQFDPAATSRTAKVTLFLGGAGFATGANALWYEVGNNANLPPGPPPSTNPTLIGRVTATQVANPFTGFNNQNANGYWDSYTFNVTVPAGATWLAVQPDSKDGVDPQRLEWVGSNMEMPLACPEYTISKTRTTADFVQAGQAVTFDIVVANTGNTDIITATLRDNYDITYLTYGFSGNFSTPASNDNINDGQIDWATGQGIGPILFGQSKTVTVRFTAVQSTEPIIGPPADRTINTASTLTVADQNGESAPPQTDTDDVEITNPNVTVVKTLLLPADGSTAVGGQVQWRIRVTNSGDTTLNTVPLADTYDTTYLTYGFSGSFSSPASFDNSNDGTLNWTDITGAGSLAPGSFIDVTVNMTAIASTQALANDQTINTATVTGAVDENGDTPPPASDTEPVEIGNPAVTVLKTLLTPADGSTAVGGQVQWRLRVTNSGDTILNTVPLADTYDITYLTYGFSGSFSSPASFDNTDDGALNWTDITGAGSLAPGNFIDVTVNMTAKASTQLLVNDQTINTATVTGAVDENGDTPPTASDTEPVEIGGPSVRVIKTLVIPASGSASVGGQVQWRLNVTNMGDTSLTTVPLADTYDINYLVYGFGGTFSTPVASFDNADDGALNWTDITGAGSLAPGSSIDIFVNMTAEASTQNLPNQQTINTATVTGAVDENNDPVPPSTDTEPVRIISGGAIGDYVWYDTNADGIQDVTENGIGNVTVNLWLDDGDNVIDAGDTFIGTKTTGADGGYIFKDLGAGTYIVDVTDTNGILTGYTHTTGLESKPDPFVVTIGVGEFYEDADFGYVEPTTPGVAIIGDTVWMDQNQNGVQDPGEPGIPGVTVQLRDASTNAAVGAPVVTDTNGNYLITNVPPGVYYVDVIAGVPGGLSPSPAAPDPTTVFVVAANDQYLDADIGYFDPGTQDVLGTIGNLVFRDVNNNGVFNVGVDSPFGGVSVDLIRDTDNDGIWDAGEPIVATTTTATTLGPNNSNYVFTGLTAGRYLVVVSDTANVLADYSPTILGAANVDNNNQTQPYPVVLAAGANVLTADFGYVLSSPPGDNGVIGNQVWYDVDGDGIYNPASGDTGVEGVTVDLLDNANTVLATVTTGPSGDYSFTGLVAGTYKVRVTDTANVLAGYIVTTLPADQVSDNTNKLQAFTVVLPADGINLTADFGYTRPGAIGDFVWYDANADAIQDVGEPGIPFVTVDLYDAGPNGVVGGGDDVKLQSTMTDADGGYIFKNLLPGTYYVDVTDLNGNLAGLTHTLGNQSQTDPSSPIGLGVGEVYKDADFGYYQQPTFPGNAIVGDLVWYDQNQNGIQDPGEPGIAGVSVQLVDAVTNLPVGAPILTDQNGNYLFPNVPPGTYYVQASGAPLTNLTPSPAAPNPTSTFTVGANEQYLDADLGFYDAPGGTNVLGTIGNLVFEDVNKDGIYTVGTDTPFVGVSVSLIRDLDNDNVWDTNEPIIATDTTDQNGLYSFTGVPAGNYLVHVSDTNAVLLDYVKSTPTGPANVDNRNQLDPYDVTLAAGATNNTADFGYYHANREDIGVVGNQVWVEKDFNGVYDPASGDVGQAGVTVDLYLNGNYYATTTTGASGDYSFTGLPSGVYRVQVTDVQNVLSGYAVTLYPANQTADNNNKVQAYSINLPQADINLTGDFGYILPGAIGDYVWYDANADAIQDVTENGIGNVTVNLWKDNNTSGTIDGGDTLIGTKTTGLDGGYLFTNLLPGAYIVDVTDTNGILTGLTHTTGLQSQVDPFAVALVAGQSYLDADFGYVRIPTSGGVIGDLVWKDQNQNGIQDPGEPGIPGVTVTLKTPGNDGIPGNGDDVTVTSTTTNINGGYLFNNVPAGTYYVDATAGIPAGLSPSAAAPDPTSVFVLAAGDQYLDADIGFFDSGTPDTGAIGGTVWKDTPTTDGILGGGEPRLPGVTVDLLSGGNVVATAITNQNGDFLFTGLQPGTYQVQVTDTANVLATYDPTTIIGGVLDGTNKAQPYSVTIAAGGLNTTADFGYVPSDNTGHAGVIGNQVFNDVDGDGIYNPANGDTGIEGVTVELLDGANNVLAVTTTGPTGLYVFNNLSAGVYKVRVTDTADVLAGYLVTKPGPTPGADNNNQVQPYTINLPVDGINMTADFGYIRPGAIGDFVWYDADADAIQDVGEPGIPFVTLDLYSVGPNGVKGGGDDVLLQSTMTDADGGYIFKDLLPGIYYVDVTDVNGNLTGLTHTVGLQSQPDSSNPITLSVGEVDKTADFGYYQQPTIPGTAVVGDLVWYDQNQNGIQDPGEMGIPGVTVQLRRTSDNALIGTTTTDQNGNYLFTSVAPGTYYVDVTAGIPAGLSFSPAAPDPTASFTVVANQQYLNADVGYYDPPGGTNVLGTIGNLVFEDVDKDGAYVPANGDAPLVGVSVDLIRDIDNDNVWDVNEPVIATDTTDQSGLYLFTGLPAGNYLVHVSDTNAVLLDYVKSSTTGPANVDNRNQLDPYDVTLAAGATNLTADFGYYQANRDDIGVVGNQVWTEVDYNGVYDPASKDVGQAGVTVDLYRNGVFYATTTTGASGDYSFTGLPSGVYRVDVTDTANVLAGHIDTLFPVNQTADNNNKVQLYTISLPQAGVNLTGDFGYIRPVTIGDFVFVDPNANKVQDPSETTGLPNVPITATNLSTGQVFTTQTGPTGFYQFTNLPPGTYSVEAPPSLPLYLRTTDSPIVRTLPAGTVDNNFDFGYINPTAVAIASLSFTTSQNGVTLHWSTLFEEGSDRFFVLRSNSENGQRTVLTPDGIASTGNPDGSTYQYLDASATLGKTYYYWVEVRPQGDLHGPVVVPYLSPDAGALKIFLPNVVRRH